MEQNGIEWPHIEFVTNEKKCFEWFSKWLGIFYHSNNISAFIYKTYNKQAW